MRANFCTTYATLPGNLKVRHRFPLPGHWTPDNPPKGFSFFSSFGCPEPCTFCCSPQLTGRRWKAIPGKALAEEIAERPYVTLGFASLLAMSPLALTLTRAWQRRLGRRWLALHRLAYPAALLAAAHFVWLVKKDLREPLVYGAVLALLLGARVVAATAARVRGDVSA